MNFHTAFEIVLELAEQGVLEANEKEADEVKTQRTQEAAISMIRDHFKLVPKDRRDEFFNSIKDKQWEQLLNYWLRDDNGKTYGEFLCMSGPTFGCDDAITVKWSGMWLCIETNGYTHS